MKYIVLCCLVFACYVANSQHTAPLSAFPLSNHNFEASYAAINPDSVVRLQDKKAMEFVENCWFVDGLVGFNGLRSNVLTTTAFSIAGRVGRKWYLGEYNKWQFGVQGTFMRLGLSFGLPQNTSGAVSNSTLLYFAPSAGFINAFQINDKYAVEANLNIGFNLNMTFFSAVNGSYRQDATIVQPGFMVNPCVKFRIKSLAVGLDVAVLYSGAANYVIVDNAGTTFNATASGGTIYITSITVGKTF